MRIRGAVVNTLPAPGEHIEAHELCAQAGALLGYPPARCRKRAWKQRVGRAVDALADEGRLRITDAGLVEVLL